MMHSQEFDHAVNRLRVRRLHNSTRPFKARGGLLIRCPNCQLAERLCICAHRPRLRSEAAFCLVMYDTEPMKPSNTGRLIADVLPDSTYAFLWSRTEPDPELLALLADPQWQPIVIFPDCPKAPERVISQFVPEPNKRPLFILLDGTWPEARKMFNKSPWLDGFPVWSISPEALSDYRMRQASFEHHLCTAEVAACVLAESGNPQPSQALSLWFALFRERYIAGKRTKREDDSALCAELDQLRADSGQSL